MSKEITGLILCPYQYCEIAAERFDLDRAPEHSDARRLWINRETGQMIEHVGTLNSLLNRPKGLTLYLTPYSYLTAPKARVKNHIDGLDYKVKEIL